MRFFSDDEQSCNCNCGLKINNAVLNDMIIRAREIANIPFVVTSWTRCKEHNRASNGSSSSSHLTGKAIDISFKNSVDKFKIVNALMSAGFTRIGINEKAKFIHCDISLQKAQNVLFTY